MTSLLPNIQPHKPVQNMNFAPQNQIQMNVNYPSTSMPIQSSYMASPSYGRYAMFTGFMSAILGGLWYAQPKHSVHDLTTMTDDEFTKVTKKAQSSMPTSWQAFKTAKQEIVNDSNNILNTFFNSCEQTTQKDILKLLNKASEEELQSSIDKLTTNIQKYLEINTETFFDEMSSAEKLSAAQKKLIKEALGDDILKEIENKNISNIKDFIIKKYKQTRQQLQKEKFGQLLCNNASDGVVHKSLIQNQTKHFFINEHINKLELYYSEFSSKLPKKIFKTMAKWFAIGVGLSLAIDTISALFNRNKH